jgi:hypothetical protein
MAITALNTLKIDKKERLSTTVSSNSTPYKLVDKSKISVHLILNNVNEVGNLKVQLTNDDTAEYIPSGVNWVNVWYRDETEVLQTSGLNVTAGNNVNFMFDPIETHAKYLRVSYTRISGGATTRFIEIYVNDSSR